MIPEDWATSISIPLKILVNAFVTCHHAHFTDQVIIESSVKNNVIKVAYSPPTQILCIKFFKSQH